MNFKSSHVVKGANPVFRYKNILLLIFCGSVIYSNSFFVPWYGDDFAHIVENPNVGNWDYWLTRFFSLRWITGLSFALNYQIHGLELWGYHFANLCIHLISSSVVYALLRRIFTENEWLPLFGALIFLAHPIQTQAVTYIVQRSTSLAGMFVLLGLFCWVLAVEKNTGKTDKKYNLDKSWYLLALFFGALAVMSKANAVVFPLLVLLFDFYILDKTEEYNWRQRLCYFLPLFIVPSLIVLKLAFGGVFSQMIPILSQAGSETKTVATASHVLFFESRPDLTGHLIGTLTPENLQSRYLATETIVIWEYLRMLVLPIGQKLDYSYPLVEAIFNWKTIIASVAWLSLGVATFVFRKNRLWLFSILWFLICLSVESTFIPLDPLFEHRLYLPMFGFVVAFLGFVSQWQDRKFMIVGLIVIVTILAVLTYKRNELWASPVDFWQDNALKTAESYRPWATLGSELVKAERYSEALVPLRLALKMDSPVENETHANIGLAFIKLGKFQEARDALSLSLTIKENSPDVHTNLGTVLIDLGEFQPGIKHLERAVELAPRMENGLSNLAGGYFRLGDYRQSARIYTEMVDLFPESAHPVFGLGLVYARLNQTGLALDSLEKAFRMDQQNVQYAYYYALIAVQSGQKHRVVEVVDHLRRNAPQYFSSLQPYL